MNPDVPLTPAVFHVLLSLSEGPLHGYAVMQAAAESSGIDMGPGTVYGSIRRLEETGWVRETEAPGDAGAEDRRRRYYEMTSAGRAALRSEASRLTRITGLAAVRRLAAGESR